MKLNKEVWHGYVRPAGEEITPIQAPIKGDVKDSHGCESLWVRDSRGDRLSVWICEVSA